MILLDSPISCPREFEVTPDLTQKVFVVLPNLPEGAWFRRTVYAAIPQSLQVASPIQAHYRQEVAENAMHLLALKDGTILVAFFDEKNPDLGGAAAYQKQDVESQKLNEVRVPSSASSSMRIGNAAGLPVIPTGGLAWGRKASSREFVLKAMELADEVKTHPSWLLTQFWGESNFNPQANLTNGVSSGDPARIGPKTIGGGLFGLMKKWSQKALGVDFYDFMKMSALEQLEVAKRFYGMATGKLRSMNDVFIFTFWPAALGKKDDTVLMRKGDGVYEQNRQMDTTGEGIVTKGEAAKLRYDLYLEGMKPGNRLDDWSQLPESSAPQLQGAVSAAPSMALRGGVSSRRGSELVHLLAGVIQKQTKNATAAKKRAVALLSSPKRPVTPGAWLAYVQRLLMEQAILTLTAQFLEAEAKEDALPEEEEELLDVIEQHRMPESEIEKLRRAESTHLRFEDPKAFAAQHIKNLMSFKDDLAKYGDSEAHDLALLATSELIALQQASHNTSESLTQVAFPEESAHELAEQWVDDLLDIYNLGEEP